MGHTQVKLYLKTNNVGNYWTLLGQIFELNVENKTAIYSEKLSGAACEAGVGWSRPEVVVVGAGASKKPLLRLQLREAFLISDKPVPT